MGKQPNDVLDDLWHVGQGKAASIIYDANGWPLANTTVFHGRHDAEAGAADIAAHIVACVNALIGLPSDAIGGQGYAIRYNYRSFQELTMQRDELAAYAKCEEARSHGEDIAETILKQHGFDPSKGTAVEFMDKMRRAALAKVQS